MFSSKRAAAFEYFFNTSHDALIMWYPLRTDVRDLLVNRSSSGTVMSTSNGAGSSQNSCLYRIETLPGASVPPGFTRITLDDENSYLVPKYLVPALLLQISKQTETKDGDAVNPGVSSPELLFKYALIS